MHRRIAEAIAKQDVHRSAAEMRSHLEKVRKLYLEVPILLEMKGRQPSAMGTIAIGETAP